MFLSRLVSIKVVGFFLLGFAVVGCGLKEKREEEKARRAADLSQMIGQEQESDRVDLAKQDLNKQITFYRAISGTYEGSIVLPQQNFLQLPAGLSTAQLTEIPFRIVLSTANIPSAYDQVRLERESDIVNQINNINLNADIVMGAPGSIIPQSICNANSIRPDLQAGTFRVSCADPASPQGSRTYNFTISDAALVGATQSEQVAQGTSLASALTQGTMTTVSAMVVDMYTNSAFRRGFLRKAQ